MDCEGLSAEFLSRIELMALRTECKPKRGGSTGEREMAAREITTGSASIQTTTAITTAANYTRPLAVVTTLFFMWGFLTCLNDILVPHLKSVFDLSYARVMLIQFAFLSAYFLSSVPWSRSVTRIGYHSTMVVGRLTLACGALLFQPAASASSFRTFFSAQ